MIVYLSIVGSRLMQAQVPTKKKFTTANKHLIDRHKRMHRIRRRAIK